MENLPQGLCRFKWSSPIQIKAHMRLLANSTIRCFHTSLPAAWSFAALLCECHLPFHGYSTEQPCQYGLISEWRRSQARNQDRFGGRRGDPQKWTFWTQKVDFLKLTPLTPLQKPHFWPNLCLKVDFLADLGRCIALPPLLPGYGPGRSQVFWPNLCLKVDLLADLGRCIALPPLLPGYGPGRSQVELNSTVCNWIQLSAICCCGKRGKVINSLVNAACRLVIPERQVEHAELYRYHHQSGKLVWKQDDWHTKLSINIYHNKHSISNHVNQSVTMSTSL